MALKKSNKRVNAILSKTKPKINARKAVEKVKSLGTAVKRYAVAVSQKASALKETVKEKVRLPKRVEREPEPEQEIEEIGSESENEYDYNDSEVEGYD